MEENPVITQIKTECTQLQKLIDDEKTIDETTKAAEEYVKTYEEKINNDLDADKAKQEELDYRKIKRSLTKYYKNILETWKASAAYVEYKKYLAYIHREKQKKQRKTNKKDKSEKKDAKDNKEPQQSNETLNKIIAKKNQNHEFFAKLKTQTKETGTIKKTEKKNEPEKENTKSDQTHTVTDIPLLNQNADQMTNQLKLMNNITIMSKEIGKKYSLSTWTSMALAKLQFKEDNGGRAGDAKEYKIPDPEDNEALKKVKAAQDTHENIMNKSKYSKKALKDAIHKAQSTKKRVKPKEEQKKHRLKYIEQESKRPEDFELVSWFTEENFSKWAKEEVKYSNEEITKLFIKKSSLLSSDNFPPVNGNLVRAIEAYFEAKLTNIREIGRTFLSTENLRKVKLLYDSLTQFKDHKWLKKVNKFAETGAKLENDTRTLLTYKNIIWNKRLTINNIKMLFEGKDEKTKFADLQTTLLDYHDVLETLKDAVNAAQKIIGKTADGQLYAQLGMLVQKLQSLMGKLKDLIRYMQINIPFAGKNMPTKANIDFVINKYELLCKCVNDYNKNSTLIAEKVTALKQEDEDLQKNENSEIIKKILESKQENMENMKVPEGFICIQKNVEELKKTFKDYNNLKPLNDN